MNEPLFDMEDLTVAYDGRKVLDLPRLALDTGRVIALLGANGAGKTTLLDVLAFLLQPTRGTIRFHGEPVEYSTATMVGLRRRVALVPQQPILFTTTVSRNVEFPLKIRKIPRDERRGMVERLLDLVGMSAFIEAKGHRLSGGETQRVAMARALACSPEVILLDEPTSSVDVENQIAIEGIIREINREKGISVVFTTHDMLQASRLAQETVYLFQGRVAETVHENLFSGMMESDSRGNTYCRISESIRFPVATHDRGRVRISIHPDRVLIHDLTAGGMEIDQDALTGKLIQLSDHRGDIRALVDAGVLVSVMVGGDVFKAFPLAIGQTVRLTFPEGSVHIL